ncbi:MAG: hypothetical protein ACLRL7_04465 [Blautia wexlerae]
MNERRYNIWEKNTYEAPVVNTLDGNGNGTDPNVQPAGLVWQTEIAVAYAYALVLVVWSQIDVTP